METRLYYKEQMYIDQYRLWIPLKTILEKARDIFPSYYGGITVKYNETNARANAEKGKFLVYLKPDNHNCLIFYIEFYDFPGNREDVNRLEDVLKERFKAFERELDGLMELARKMDKLDFKVDLRDFGLDQVE